MQVPKEPPTTGESLRIRRGSLPHWQLGGSVYFVTFRSVRGILPHAALTLVEEAIRQGDGESFDLIMGVLMPDHVHLILRPRPARPGRWHDLSQILKQIKGASARRINERLGTSGKVWQKESFDRILRDEKEYRQKLQYVFYNAVEAGLVEEPQDYEFLIFSESENLS